MLVQNPNIVVEGEPMLFLLEYLTSISNYLQLHLAIMNFAIMNPGHKEQCPMAMLENLLQIQFTIVNAHSKIW